MGRGQKRSWGGGGGRGGGRGGNSWQQDKRPKKDYLQREDMSNTAFEEYYWEQGIVPEGEWDAFLATLRRPLPVTFRINGSGKFADHLRDKLQTDFFAKLGSEEFTVDGEDITPPRQLPWYPNGYAWQLEFSRNQLRKMPLLATIHDFVKHANEAGSISRQEAVSMVPPLFLDVQPNHRVLDMCAAPGSKTFQLLEALHAGSRPGQTPPGFVVANDADFMRCNLLTHQTKRVCSPCLLVTNHDASRFPTYLAGAPVPSAEPSAAADASADPSAGVAAPAAPSAAPRRPRTEVRFDRILADVPCSGDGTLRKSPDIWRRWNVSGGNGLHSMQLRIALHGAKLLEVGGRLVYSTCTFNPIEDEAVVAELLLRCGGALELLDVSDCLPELKRMPGKHHWKVRDKHRFYNSWEEAWEIGHRLEGSMFSSPAKAALPLERCMRFLPHHGDTGGFFVAVLRKVSELPSSQARQGCQLQGEAQGADDGGDKLEAEEDAAAAACAVAGAEAGAEVGEGAEAGKGEDEEEEAGGEAGGKEQTAAAPEATPLDAARAAAEAAVAAAERALSALESGDVDGASRAAAHAAASARKATAATGKGQSQGPRTAPLERRQQLQERSEGWRPKGNQAEQGEAVEAEDEEAGLSTAVQVSWIRGSGGRGRVDGGKFAYMDPVAPLEDEAVLSSMYDYYGISADFPLRSQLIMRSLDRQPKRLYFVARSVLDLLMADSKEALKIVSTGLKVFERQVIRDQVNECPYRLAQEGLPLVLPYITRQRIEVPPQVMLQLLRERNLILPEAAAAEGDTTASGNPRGNKPTLTDERVLAALEPLKLGCVVCELSAEDARRLGFAASHRAAPAEARALASAGAAEANGGAAEANGGAAEANGGAAEANGGAAEANGGAAEANGGAAEANGGAAEANGGAGGSADGEEVTGGLAANAPLAVVGWKGKASLAIMVEKAECAQMIDKLEEELKKLTDPISTSVAANPAV